MYSSKAKKGNNRYRIKRKQTENLEKTSKENQPINVIRAKNPNIRLRTMNASQHRIKQMMDFENTQKENTRQENSRLRPTATYDEPNSSTRKRYYKKSFHASQ
jgi:hypothetical protein